MDWLTFGASAVVSFGGSGAIAAWINGGSRANLASKQAEIADDAASRALLGTFAACARGNNSIGGRLRRRR